ncbi:MAG: hypothetical protein GY711_30400 [bacterium]|nr:hypothetical protein [bacterium]
MIAAHLECDRPVRAEVGVRLPEEPQGDQHRGGSDPRQGHRQLEVREVERRREQVQHREQEAADEDDAEQRLLRPIDPADLRLDALDAGAWKTCRMPK